MFDVISSIPEEFLKKHVKLENCNILIGHNRAASTNTSEKEKDSEAHPFCSEDGSFCIVHNGHIHWYKELRNYLMIKGHKFESGVDSEVIVHILEDLLKQYDRKESIFRLYQMMEGENILILFKDGPIKYNQIVDYRNGSLDAKKRLIEEDIMDDSGNIRIVSVVKRGPHRIYGKEKFQYKTQNTAHPKEKRAAK